MKPPELPGKIEWDAFEFHRDQDDPGVAPATRPKYRQAAEKWIDKAEEQLLPDPSRTSAAGSKNTPTQEGTSTGSLPGRRGGQFIGSDDSPDARAPDDHRRPGHCCVWAGLGGRHLPGRHGRRAPVIFHCRRLKDFSKIQGGSSTRLSLSSANVDEGHCRRDCLRRTGGQGQAVRSSFKDKGDILKQPVTFHNVGLTFKHVQGRRRLCLELPVRP